MNKDLLTKEIERRIFAECKGTSYSITPELVTIDTASKKIRLDGDIFFLSSTQLDVPLTARVKFNSPDNYLCLSKTQLNSMNLNSLQSFRDYLEIKTENYGTSLVPYQVEFLRVTPIK